MARRETPEQTRDRVVATLGAMARDRLIAMGVDLDALGSTMEEQVSMLGWQMRDGILSLEIHEVYEESDIWEWCDKHSGASPEVLEDCYKPLRRDGE